jgi:hypothetical protein
VLGKGINIFIEKLIGSHNVGSQKFENGQLSFVSSHKPDITFFLNLN